MNRASTPDTGPSRMGSGVPDHQAIEVPLITAKGLLTTLTVVPESAHTRCQPGAAAARPARAPVLDRG